jgi:hypothetical protein
MDTSDENREVGAVLNLFHKHVGTSIMLDKNFHLFHNSFVIQVVPQTTGRPCFGNLCNIHIVQDPVWNSLVITPSAIPNYRGKKPFIWIFVITAIFPACLYIIHNKMGAAGGKAGVL